MLYPLNNKASSTAPPEEIADYLLMSSKSELTFMAFKIHEGDQRKVQSLQGTIFFQILCFECRMLREFGSYAPPDALPL